MLGCERPMANELVQAMNELKEEMSCQDRLC